MKYVILTDKRGNTLIVALVFLGIFVTLTTAMLSYVQLEVKVSTRSTARAEALAAAETGIDYYRWHLAHAPDDFTDGTGKPGPYVHEYRDPQGGRIGTFTLTITPRDTCSRMIRIQSQGMSDKDPKATRTIAVTYGTPALTKYAFLTNANIWFGGGGELKGPIHGNGGIRMDAEHNGRITSAKATYICGKEHGCNPSTTKPGIWGAGSGGGKGLWDFPAPSVNFETIGLDLKALQIQARNSGTLFSASGAFGYHVRLKEDGAVDVLRVTEITPKVWGYDGRVGWIEAAEGIKSETLVRTVTLPEANNCGEQNLLFFEDTIWVDGATKRPVTLIAARFPETDATNASIFVNGNLTTPAGGQEGKLGSIGLIAQKDILLPLASPDTLEIHAALFAKNGHIFRNYYCADERLNRYGYKCKSSYGPFVIRSSVNVKGTLITNQIMAFTWVNAMGQVISGYRGGENTYETRLIFAPPPFFPRQGESRILMWEEMQ